MSLLFDHVVAVEFRGTRGRATARDRSTEMQCAASGIRASRAPDTELEEHLSPDTCVLGARGTAFVLCDDLVGVTRLLGRSARSGGHRIGWPGAVPPVDRGGTQPIGWRHRTRSAFRDARRETLGARPVALVMQIPGNSQLVISEISFPLETLVGMREASGERARLGDRTRLEVPTVLAEVLEGVITAPDLAYVSERLHQMCREYAGRVRRARARLFGPGRSGVTFAEATLILRDGSTVSERGDGLTTREAVDLVVSRLARQLRTPQRPLTS